MRLPAETGIGHRPGSIGVAPGLQVGRDVARKQQAQLGCGGEVLEPALDVRIAAHGDHTATAEALERKGAIDVCRGARRLRMESVDRSSGRFGFVFRTPETRDLLNSH